MANITEAVYNTNIISTYNHNNRNSQTIDISTNVKKWNLHYTKMINLTTLDQPKTIYLILKKFYNITTTYDP